MGVFCMASERLAQQLEAAAAERRGLILHWVGVGAAELNDLQ